MKNILIAGGHGFIGSNLIKHLQKTTNDSIFVIDSGITGNNTNIAKNYLKFDISSVSFVNLAKAHLPDTIDEIWNLACPASPKMYRKYPMETINACTKGVANLCELSVYYNAMFLHTSTSEVYGQTTETMNESNFGYVNTFGPRSCYDEGKRIAETIIYEYMIRYKEYGFNAHIARLFNTYGPYMKYDDGRIIPNFIVRALHNDPLYIYGSRNKTRCFNYIDDTINGLQKLMNSDIHTPTNIGNNNECTLAYIAETIIELINSRSLIDIVDSPTDDPQKRKPCIYKAKTQLDYIPQTYLHDGLQKTIQYYEDFFSIPENEYQYQLIKNDISFKQAYPENKI